ncbi:hypothetical protein [Caballeronia catudaia]|uniref:hypothetical protein n=1 Tax=Caballeronia catudaia TaxID=1777136 RepID=UPI000772466A|nr:hypothetical protein [Caballeronia catudaia]
MREVRGHFGASAIVQFLEIDHAVVAESGKELAGQPGAGSSANAHAAVRTSAACAMPGRLIVRLRYV